MTDAPILEVRNISKAFGGIMALNDVSFDVNAGEILGIIGPNGSGKTTIVNCITGFVKPSSGRVLVSRPGHHRQTTPQDRRWASLRTFQIMRPYYSLPAYKNLVIPLFARRGRRTGGMAGRRQAGRPGHRGYRHTGRDRF
jgi:branched-chain amino acid transport system ATP-binding protein